MNPATIKCALVARAALMAIGAGALLATPVHAQWTGSRIGSNAKKSNPEELLQVTAECVARRGPAYAKEILQELPGSEAEFLLLRTNEGDIGNCMDNSDLAVGSVEMTFTARVFRPALAAEMLRKRLSGEKDMAALSEGEAWFLPALAGADLDAFDGAYLSYLEFGDCVVSSAPAEAIAYLRTDEDSAEEAKLLSALMPALSPCISSGQEVELTHKSLRMALSEPAYHRIAKAEGED